MQVTSEQLSPSEIEFKIEIEAEEVAKTIDQVYREFSQSAEVPGFRKGKAPRHLLERYISAESVKRRAVELMVPPAYRKALEEKDVHPYAEPEVQIVQLDMEQPFIFKAAVPLPPKVELGEYKGIEAERRVAQITDGDVEAQLKHLQESRAIIEKVEGRGIQKGDVVVADIVSTVEGLEKGSPRRSLLEVGANVPGFDENILGSEAGQRRVFTIQYPKDFSDQELAGKNVEFDVTVESISERRIPELDDEFAKAVGNFETLADLRKDIGTRLAASAEEGADKEVERKIIDEVVARSKIDFPDVLVEHEVEHDLEDIQARLDRQRLTLQQYLRQTGRTEEQFLSELRDEASRGVRIGLVLGEISTAESIGVTDEEADAEIERMTADLKATRESVEAYIEARGGRPALKNSLLNRKIIEFLKSVSTVK
ncbi:MAG TPA: trigger factor [Armatimonadota bacterium]|nr:trigger factor [Armatimonadota bacterium]